MRSLTKESFESFVASRLAAPVLFDAAWDSGYRDEIRARLDEAHSTRSDQSFDRILTQGPRSVEFETLNL